MVLSVIYLGRVPYRDGLEIQARLVELRKSGAIADVLVMLEHPPVLTLGRNSHANGGGRENLLLGEAALAARGVEVVETNRGGDITYHGPGQLVGYPIFDLRGPVRGDRKWLGPVDFVRQMEEALIRTMADYGVATQRVPGRTGVWTQPNGSLRTKIQEKKIAAIGIHVSAGVTSHGFALNVTTDLRDFAWIVPCGISDRGVTSLELESPTAYPVADLTLQTVAERVARQFGQIFHAQVLWLDSIEELRPARVTA
ncbi:MAG TPA: lipoyl(octanoyl) transferase LipB [Acidobacteriaceae bacterium]